MTSQAIAPSEDAADANRSGQMTEEQKRRAAAAVRAATSSGLIGRGALTLLLGLAFFMLLPTLFAFNWTVGAVLLLAAALFLAALLAFIRLYRRQIALLREVQAGHQEHAIGHVEFKDGHYQSQVPGRSLDLRSFNLAAGDYDFAYLPLSGRVISAELAGPESPAQARDELRHALAVTNHFNLDDLPTYRTGQLGPLRRRMLRATLSTYAWFLLAATIFLALSIGAATSSTPNNMATLFFMITIFLILCLVFGLAADYGPMQDVLDGRVASAQGVVTRFSRLVSGGRHTYHKYFYKLDDSTWEVPQYAYQALIEGQSYQVFYLPRSKKLLAIDPVLPDTSAP